MQLCLWLLRWLKRGIVTGSQSIFWQSSDLGCACCASWVEESDANLTNLPKYQTKKQSKKSCFVWFNLPSLDPIFCWLNLWHVTSPTDNQRWCVRWMHEPNGLWPLNGQVKAKKPIFAGQKNKFSRKTLDGLLCCLGLRHCPQNVPETHRTHADTRRQVQCKPVCDLYCLLA